MSCCSWTDHRCSCVARVVNMGVGVNVGFEESMIVLAVTSARGLVLCFECPLHLASCYAIVLVVLR